VKRLLLAALLIIPTFALADTVSRPAKSCGGGSAYANPCVVQDTDLNGDYDALANEINGNLANVNIKASAGVATSKIDDESATAAGQDADATPGDYSSRSLPTTLAGEIQRLRFKLSQAAGVQTCTRVNGSGSQDVGWMELPVASENLVANSHFGTDAGADGIPDGGFAADGASGAGVISGASTAEGFGNVWTVAGDDNEGVSYTLDKLRASTRYAIVIRAGLSAGAADITTTGANAASEWRNFDLDLSGSGFADYCGVIQTDATPTNIVVKVLGDGGAFIAAIRQFAVYELGAVPREDHRANHVSTDRDNTAAFVAGAGDTVTDASIAITLPDTGYLVKATADGWCIQDTTGAGTLELDIEEDGTDILDAMFLGNSSGGSVTTGLIFPFSITRVSVAPAAGNHTYRVVGSATTRDWTCTTINLLVERIRLY
jgi:hypothetical protein